MSSNTFTFYSSSILKAKKALNALSSILHKGQDVAHADSLPSARIYDDMLPLTMQVSIACAHANKLVARTTGFEIPCQENNLSSFDDMLLRVAQTQDLLARADEEIVNKSAGDLVAFQIKPDQMVDLPVVTLASDYYLPNIFFHVLTAYNILRKEGVPLGKQDYEGAFMAVHVLKE